MKDVNKIMKFT